MPLSKKKKQEIERVSFMFELLKSHTPKEVSGGIHWVDTPPEMWSDNQKQLFEMMNELERKTIEEVLNIVG